jgi:hypothetical protein
VPCNCNDLIGRPYRRGADGTGAEIDCIHLVFEVLRRHQIPTPAFNHDWYKASTTTVLRALLTWGNRIARPEADGDVLLIRQEHWAFGVTWQTGILYINQDLQKVAWASVRNIANYHCFRLKNN